jgi:ribonuclease HI
MNEITIFADGSSRGNPGRGGFATIIRNAHANTVIEIGGAVPDTTNNRMELLAVISGGECLVADAIKGAAIHWYIDSQYVKKGITEWVIGWKKSGWITSTKTEVLNRDLWERLDASITHLKEENTIVWHVIEGHVGIPANERCDEIATSFADGEAVDLYQGSADAYPVDMDNVVALTEKKEKKSRSSRKAYAYVSMVDGVFSSDQDWASCEKRVKGKAGARFKKVFSQEEEQEAKKEWLG